MGETTDIDPDPVIEFYKKNVDRNAIRENLRLTVEQRLENLERRLRESAEEIRRAEAATEKPSRAD